MRALIAASAALALLVMAPGCSLIMMERLDHRYGPDHYEEPRCTANKGWPLLDASAAISGAIETGALLATLDRFPEQYRDQATLSAVPSAAFALAFGVSAFLGNRGANRCRAARAIKDDNVRGQGRLP